MAGVARSDRKDAGHAAEVGVGSVLGDYCDYCYYCYCHWHGCDCSLVICLGISLEALTLDNALAKLPRRTSDIHRATRMAFRDLPCTRRAPSRSAYEYSSYVASFGTFPTLPPSGQRYSSDHVDTFLGDSDHDKGLSYICYCELSGPAPAASGCRDAVQSQPGL